MAKRLSRKKEKTLMVKLMEFAARNIEDEDIFDSWLMCGVADSDIAYGDFDPTDESLDYYIEDENYQELIELFLRLVDRAHRNGGFC